MADSIARQDPFDLTSDVVRIRCSTSNSPALDSQANPLVASPPTVCLTLQRNPGSAARSSSTAPAAGPHRRGRSAPQLPIRSPRRTVLPGWRATRRARQYSGGPRGAGRAGAVTDRDLAVLSIPAPQAAPIVLAAAGRAAVNLSPMTGVAEGVAAAAPTRTQRGHRSIGAHSATVRQHDVDRTVHQEGTIVGQDDLARDRFSRHGGLR
jgi:hypothetical protein